MYFLLIWQWINLESNCCNGDLFVKLYHMNRINILLTLLLLAPVLSQSPDPTDALRTIDRLLEHSRYAEAELQSRKLLTKQPGVSHQVAARFRLLESLERSGATDQALLQLDTLTREIQGQPELLQQFYPQLLRRLGPPGTG